MTRAREISNVLGRNIESTTFTATAGQTAFSITHAAGRIQVYMNGLLLDPTVDWTSDGSTVTLTEGATAGDELEVVKFDNLAVADAIPATGGTFTGAVTHNDDVTVSGDLTVSGTMTGDGSGLTGVGYTPPAGMPIKLTDFSSTAGTNNTNTSEHTVAAGGVTVTASSANSKYVYHITTSAETDISTTNVPAYMWVEYRVNGGSWSTNTRMINFSTHQGTGTMEQSLTQTFTITSAVGASIEFRLRAKKSNASSFYWNQQSLGSQPSGKSNSCSGYVMEVQT